MCACSFGLHCVCRLIRNDFSTLFQTVGEGFAVSRSLGRHFFKGSDLGLQCNLRSAHEPVICPALYRHIMHMSWPVMFSNKTWGDALCCLTRPVSDMGSCQISTKTVGFHKPIACPSVYQWQVHTA